VRLLAVSELISASGDLEEYYYEIPSNGKNT
jgi:hypothetical protein